MKGSRFTEEQIIGVQATHNYTTGIGSSHARQIVERVRFNKPAVSIATDSG